jgi:hypothetical protein
MTVNDSGGTGPAHLGINQIHQSSIFLDLLLFLCLCDLTFGFNGS